jgi:hypothetical protein
MLMLGQSQAKPVSHGQALIDGQENRDGYTEALYLGDDQEP